MKLMMIAGEVSGDQHGAALIQEMKKKNPEIEIFGIGGMLMIQAGLRAYYTISSLQVHGIIEVIRHLPRLYRILWNMREALVEEKPQILILIDYPGFNLKVAQYAKQIGVPVVFFNSPQIWAWRKRRLYKIQKYVDHMLVLYPFEQKIYEEAQVPVSFIGHPASDVQVSAERIQTFQHEKQLSKEQPIVAILPGSRPSEIKQHLPILVQALVLLREKQPHLRVLLPMVNSIDPTLVKEIIASSEVPIELVYHRFWEVISVANVAIVASGTATLQTALQQTPFIVIYRVSAFTYWLGKKLAQVAYICIVNILLNREIVPELLQHEFTPERVSEKIHHLLEDASAQKKMQTSFRELKAQIHTGGTYRKAAEILLDLAEKKKN